MYGYSEFILLVLNHFTSAFMILTGVIRAFFIFPSPESNSIIQKFPKDFVRFSQIGCLYEIAITFYLIIFGVLLSSAEFKFRPIL